jgi:hypothetical protein
VEELTPDEFGRGATVPLASKPCRGLVLVRSYGDDGYFVFNLSTGESLALPDSDKPLKMKMRSGLSSWEKPKLSSFYVGMQAGTQWCFFVS